MSGFPPVSNDDPLPDAPTAVHVFALAQDTAENALSGTPLTFAVCWMLQREPFQRSASVAVPWLVT